MKTEWRYPFDDSGLNYLSAKAKQIHDIAALLGVPAPGLAGGIAREMTLQRLEYPNDLLWVAGQPVKALLTSAELDEPGRDPMTADSPLLPWKPITHGTIAEYFARSNTLPRSTLGNPSRAERLANPVFFDVGPGNIKIRTAISMLQNYNRVFPDSDPLDLKRYNDRYDLLLRDLKNPDRDTTIKIAGLVAREGQDFFTRAMTPQRWAALSEDQRTAALTKYYAIGKERMEDDFAKRGGNPNTYTPDFNGDGSDMDFYQRENTSVSNPELLRKALSPDQRSEVAPGKDSVESVVANTASSTSRPYGAAQTASLSAPTMASSLPPQVVASGDYLRANGIAITPRTMYMAHVIGPERTVDVIRRTGSTFSPDVPSADAETGDQVRAWVRALRGVPPAAPAVGAGLAGFGGGAVPAAQSGGGFDPAPIVPYQGR